MRVNVKFVSFSTTKNINEVLLSDSLYFEKLIYVMQS